MSAPLRLLPAAVEAGAGAFDAFADGLDDAFLNFYAGGAAPRGGLIDDRDPIVAGLFERGDQIVDDRVFFDRLGKFQDRQQGHIELERRDGLVTVLARALDDFLQQALSILSASDDY